MNLKDKEQAVNPLSWDFLFVVHQTIRIMNLVLLTSDLRFQEGKSDVGIFLPFSVCIWLALDRWLPRMKKWKEKWQGTNTRSISIQKFLMSVSFVIVNSFLGSIHGCNFFRESSFGNEFLFVSDAYLKGTGAVIF